MSSAGFQRNNGRRNFQVFYTNKRPEIARKYPFLGAKQIQRKVEELWRSLDPGEKEEFRVVSPAVANNFRRQAWQEEGEKSLTSRLNLKAGELEEPSNSGYCETISVSDYEGDQQQEADVHHSTSTTNNEFELTFVCKTDKKSTENTLERTTTWEKKPYRHAGLDLCSEAESDHHYYLPRTARNRTKSSSRSKGVLTLHMAKMQMVATTSAGIGKGEITRTSNSESEGISCSEDWFDQDIVTEQLPENKRSYIGDDTTSVGQAPPMDEIVESTDFVNTDKDVTEAGDAKDEDNNVERNEDGGEHILSLESKKAITQYLNVEKFDEQIDEKGEETRIPDVESKETVDPDKQLERQEDDPWDMHTEETEQGGHLKQENHGDHETVPSSSGGFLCELFSDHKPNTGAWLPGFNRSVPDCPESDANFIDIEDDGIFL
ncbi:Hypp3780 [Branchiostoma lanceolatum]|uniref:Hypp3780 protein n=1 Tax=Branchiostoma lanceolatum TaxID=7740 RepID=A0A8K0A4J0_BRALA|nr:Hypp3780 [Branchiostoma lanceolatum]